MEKHRNPFVEKVFAYMTSQNMIREGDVVAAGVSGGADSVCLLLLLELYRERVPFDLRVVHVEHGLRGDDSLADMEYVRSLCDQREIPFTGVRSDAAAVAARQGISTEEAGRQIRYKAFREEIRDAGERGRIAVAHHLEDQAETVLFQLCRGSGLRGLAGMRPVKDGIIRPLLTSLRAEIEDWLRREGVFWRTDVTNEQTLYTRNRIRHRILPLLRGEVNARSPEHICAAAEKAGGALDYLVAQADGWLRMHTTLLTEDGISIEARQLAMEHPALREMVWLEAVRRGAGEGSGRDFGEIHVKALTDLLGDGRYRRIDLPGGVKAERRGGAVRIWREIAQAGDAVSPGREGSQEGDTVRDTVRPGRESPQQASPDAPLPVTVTGSGQYDYRGWRFAVQSCAPRDLPSQKELREEKKYTKWLAYDTMNGEICIRSRLPGDYLLVGEGRGHKKLKDYLIDEKIPAPERDAVPLVAQGSHILWVVGRRISAGARVKADETRDVIRITACLEENE